MFIEDEKLIVKELQSCENQRKGLYVPNKQGKQAAKKVQFLQVQKEKKKKKSLKYCYWAAFWADWTADCVFTVMSLNVLCSPEISASLFF